MIKVLKGEKGDHEEIIDFANYVFSHSAERVDFPSILPKLYKKEYDMTSHHYLVKEDGKIKAMVGSFPLKLDVFETELKIRGIGTVAVHPYARSKGYMKELMEHAIQDMEQGEVDMSILSGRRQRYENFGYAKVGTKVQFSVKNYNISYVLGKDYNFPYKLIRVDRRDTEILDAAYTLHSQQKTRFLRERDKFFDICSSWESEMISIYEKDVFKGYILCSKNKLTIPEIVLEDETILKQVIAQFIIQYDLEEVSLSIGAYETQKIKLLKEISESCTISSPCNFRVFNFQRVLDAFLKVKANYETLIDGELILGIKEKGNYKIQVEKNQVNVVATNETADLELTYFEAMTLCFDPMSHYISAGSNVDRLLNAYFPLSLYVPLVDNV